VLDDKVFVVERDNHRVQVLQLPDFKPLGSFGEDALRQPYGLWVQANDAGYDVRVSDAYMDGDDDNEVIPGLSALNERFERFQVSLGDAGFRATAIGAFGDTDTAGAIRIPESIWGDPTHDRLLLSEEDQADGSGYWLATDQFKDRSVFHVFDRRSLAHIGAFVGDVVANTDGVWLSQTATARFPAGAFYAVHDDQGVAAFDWRDVASALNLTEACPVTAP